MTSLVGAPVIGNASSVYARSGIPMLTAPSGTMGANGAFTLGTALAMVYQNCFLFFPLGAIYPNSPAGLWFCQMLNTTQGKVFNYQYTQGIPAQIPTNPPAFSGTPASSWTGIVDLNLLTRITVPGGSLGPNAMMRVTALFSVLNNGNNKRIYVTLGNQLVFNFVLTTSGSCESVSEIYCRGVTNLQISFTNTTPSGAGSSANSNFATGIDLTVPQDIVFGGEIQGAATDWIVLEGYSVEIFD